MKRASARKALWGVYPSVQTIVDKGKAGDVAQLSLSISNPPTEAEVEAIRDKLKEMVGAMCGGGDDENATRHLTSNPRRLTLNSVPRRLAIYVVVIVGCLFGLYHLARWSYDRHTATVRVPRWCRLELQRIAEAKERWARDHGGTNDTPTWSDLYDGKHPKCPGSGGEYILGKVGEPPRCTIANHNLDASK